VIHPTKKDGSAVFFGVFMLRIILDKFHSVRHSRHTLKQVQNYYWLLISIAGRTPWPRPIVIPPPAWMAPVSVTNAVWLLW
jgi:hypothetical protein